MQIIKKIITLIICLQLTSAQTVFAQVAQQPVKVSQQEIEKTISKTDAYRAISLVALAGWVTAGCAVGVLIKKWYKNAATSPDKKIEAIITDLRTGMERKTISTSYVSQATRVMKNNVPSLEKEARAYFYKEYKVLPSVEEGTLAPFWEEAYVKNGGVLPKEFNNARFSSNNLVTAIGKNHDFLPYKKAGRFNELIIDINENFYKRNSLTSAQTEQAAKLSATINKDIKTLLAMSEQTVSAEVKGATKEFAAQITKGMTLSDFRIVAEELQQELGKGFYAFAGNGEQIKISNMVRSISEKVNKAHISTNETEAKKLLAEVESETQHLAGYIAKTPKGLGLGEAVESFLKQVTKEVKGKGGMVGAGAVLVAGAALLVLASGDAMAAQVSNNRVLVQRELSFSFKNTPDVFAATVVTAKEKYGLNLVSSVIYEHQEFYPLLAGQINIMTSPKGKEAVQLLMQGTSPETYKRDLLKEIKNK